MIRVIVADDEYKVCQLICQLIDWEGMGMRLVGTASNGLEALQMIEAEKPDLVLTDIRMPGFDGMELLKRARTIYPDMEFIIISGYSHFEYAQTAIRYGVSDYILKPVNREALNATLQKVRQRYLEHKTQAEEDLEQQKQQAATQARLREILWQDLETGQIPRNLEDFNEKYRYHFGGGHFQIFLIHADVKENRHLNEDYVSNVMEVLSGKLEGLFERHISPLCIDSEVFYKDRKASGILNYREENGSKLLNELEALISSLSMELHVFEHMRFHLSVGHAAASVEELPRCMKEAELAMGQRLLVRNNLFLEEVPENKKFEEDSLYQPFSRIARQCLDLQKPEQMEDAVSGLQGSALSLGLNGNQMLRLVQDSYRLFLLSSIFQEKFRFADRDGMEARFYRESLLCSSRENLFSFLAETCRRNIEEAVGWYEAERMRPINQAKQYIQEHYAESLSLEEVSSQAGFSSSYFSTLFRKETGKNFLEYLTDVRIDEAKRLLRRSGDTIEQIGKAVGMNDYKRFSKTFKKITGISPKEYRNLYS